MRKLCFIILWVFLLFVILYSTSYLVLIVFAEWGYGNVSQTERLISFIPLVIYISILLKKIFTGSRYLAWVLFIIIALYTFQHINLEKRNRIEKQDSSASHLLSKLQKEADLLRTSKTKQLYYNDTMLLHDDKVGYSNLCEIALSEGGRLYKAKEANNAQNYFCNDSVEAWAAGVVLLSGDGDVAMCVDSNDTRVRESSYMVMASSSSTECIIKLRKSKFK